MNDVDKANLRYAEAAVVERRVQERRNWDKWQRRGLATWLALASIAWVVAIAKMESVTDRSQEQREELTALVCHTLTRFIQSPPNFPRDRPALRDLARECYRLQDHVDH